jgi:DNA-binding winged helix-turn-helix (wHTH) protein
VDAAADRRQRVTRLSLGERVVDLQRQLLTDARGEPIALRPKAWAVLRCLVENEGRLVGKGTLMAAVWPDTVVTDDSLVQAVADIRRALGAGARQAVRTVPGRGYLMMARPSPPADAAGRGVAPKADKLGDRLRERAAGRFVGRELELGLLAPACAREPPAHALYFVHGPGGIGKSSLLERLRRMADGQIDVLSVNGSELMPTPQGVIDGIGAALGFAERPVTADALLVRWAARGRGVLLLDTFEVLDPVQGWLRDTWLPGLPAGVSVVLAGRRPPDSRWSAHPLWGGAMRVVPLGMLDHGNCVRLIERHGAPARLCDALARRARGLPLAAVLLAAEAGRTGRAPVELGEELVRALTRRCLEHAPSAAHREAVLTCALARRADRELLGHLFGGEPAEALFDWLAAQGYVSASREGLRLHDLMREAVLSDNDWCDRDRFRALRRAVIRFLAARLRPGRDAWDATLDSFYARRLAPGFRCFHDVDGLARVSTVIVTADDLPETLAFAMRHLSEAEHTWLPRWASHPGAELVAVREQDGGLCGVALLLRTGALGDDEVAADPVVARLRDALGSRWREPARGTYSVLVRHWFAIGDRAMPSPGLTALMAYVNPLFADPALRLFMLWSHIPPYLQPMFPELGFHDLPECACDEAGLRYQLVVRDWQAEPWGAWVRRVAAPESGL